MLCVLFLEAIQLSHSLTLLPSLVLPDTLFFVCVFVREFKSNETVAVQKSTFAIDTEQMVYLLRNCTRHSLVLIDEYGKGTLTSGECLCTVCALSLSLFLSSFLSLLLSLSLPLSLFLSQVDLKKWCDGCLLSICHRWRVFVGIVLSPLPSTARGLPSCYCVHPFHGDIPARFGGFGSVVA